MDVKPRTPEETYGPALQKAQKGFLRLNPDLVTTRADIVYKALDEASGRFEVPFLGTRYQVAWPHGSVVRAADGMEADIASHIILLHYLLTADGMPLADKWVAFRNLPGGLGYDAAFQGRASHRLAHAFGRDGEGFARAARALGGEPLSFGDASFLFRVLPRVWMAVVLHQADEEFPAGANVLFDAATEHYLPTEDLAVVGGMLAGKLIKAARHSQRLAQRESTQERRR
jgi:hypothetical protein